MTLAIPCCESHMQLTLGLTHVRPSVSCKLLQLELSTSKRTRHFEHKHHCSSCSTVLNKIKPHLYFFLKTSSIFLAFSKAEIKTLKYCVIMTDEHIKNSAFNYFQKFMCDDIHYFFQSF